jgi:hypothetical protein
MDYLSILFDPDITFPCGRARKLFLIENGIVWDFHIVVKLGVQVKPRMTFF